MSLLATVVMMAAAAAATAGADPIADCRAAHAEDSAAHIACLEAALRARVAAPVQPRDAVEALPAAAPAQPAQEPTGLGAEQARARQVDPDAPPEQVSVRIVSVRYTPGGLGVFMMADGQVWQETEPAPEYFRLQAGTEYEARIKRGVVGGYRMYVAGVQWMNKVKRLQ